MNEAEPRFRRFLAAGAAVACLQLSTALAQPAFEETEFAGWSTTVVSFEGRMVSGAQQGSGGDPGAHYEVRHRHQLFGFFPNTVVSASLSPIALDPVELGLADTPRFSVDLRFVVDYDGPQPVEPTLYWAPVLQQGGTLYRYPNAATLNLRPTASFVRVEADLQPEDWIVPFGASAPDFSPGAPPVRLGLVLQSDVLVLQGDQGEARIGIDDYRLDAVGEAALPRVSLVALPSPQGGHVVFAPPACFDGVEGEEEFDVFAEVSRDWEGCVATVAPGVELVSPPLCFVPGFGEAGRESRATFQCRAAAPSEIELLSPSGSLQAVLGTPSRARVEPCRVRVAGGDLSCSELEGVCPAETLFGLLCGPGAGDLCVTPTPVPFSATSPWGGEWSAAASSALAEPLETLLRVRDETMSESAAGRYYRDLYDAFSPELRDLLLDDLGIVRDVAAAAPAWLGALGALVDGAGDLTAITPGMLGDLLAIFDRFESRASPALRAVFRRERERLQLEDVAGLSIDDAANLVGERGGPPPCTTTATSLCVQGGRFQLEVTWSDGKGGSGAGRAVPLSEDSGYFWFFDDDNVELVIKALDGRGVNDRYWVFYGALSDVEYTVLVTDTETGALRAYRNPRGVFASVGDTDAFTEDGAARSGAGSGGVGSEATWLEELSLAAAQTVRGAWRELRGLVPRRAPVRAAATSLSTAPRPRGSVAARGACVGGGNALCLAGNRFRVEVEWRDFQGGSGFGQAAPLTADTGTFWFFDPSNTELIVKVLDARPVNGHFWVFYGALSNVEYALRVTDTATGQVRTYENPSGEFASRGDVEAF